MSPTIIESRKPQYLTAECISCNTPVEFLMPKPNGEVIYIECYACKQVLSIDIQYPPKGAAYSASSTPNSSTPNSSTPNSSNTKKDAPSSKPKRTGTGTGKCSCFCFLFLFFFLSKLWWSLLCKQNGIKIGLEIN